VGGATKAAIFPSVRKLAGPVELCIDEALKNRASTSAQEGAFAGGDFIAHRGAPEN